MKILLAVHHFPPRRVGGAELRALRTARWLMRHGHQVQVVCVEEIAYRCTKSSIKWQDDTYDNIPVRRLELCLERGLAPHKWSYANPLLEENLTDLMVSQTPDLVHLIGGYLMGVAPIRAAQHCRIPIVVTLTDYWFLCPTNFLLRGNGSLCVGPEPLECARCLYDAKRRFQVPDRHFPSIMRQFWLMVNSFPFLAQSLGLPQRLRLLEERKRILYHELGLANVVTSITQFVADRHTSNGVTGPIKVTPDCIEFSNSVVNHTPGVSHFELRFGYLGQIIPIKGIDLLIRAFRQLDRSHRSARLIIHGFTQSQPEYLNHLRRLADGDKDIVFAGAYNYSDILNVLSELDVIVVPSLTYENAPRVVLEALATRKPVIGTNVGGIAEIVKHEINGLLFKHNNISDLAQQMQRLLDEPDLVSNLRENISSVRTIDEDMTDWLTLYQGLLDKQQFAMSNVAA